MQKLKILNTRDIKELRTSLIEQFGYFPKKDYVYLITEKNKIFIVNKDISRIELDRLRIDKMGLYFAESYKNQVRLSKEGAQLMFEEAGDKLLNLIELDEIELKSYFQGEDLTKDLGKESKLIILKFKKEVIGCARYKDGIIINFLSKIHRGEVII